MKVLLIPDVHLKPHIFDWADNILNANQVDIAIQLGDLLDDWGCAYLDELYEQTLRRAIQFHKDHPDTLWCYGNHDWGYTYPEYGIRQTGHSARQEPLVASLLKEMPTAQVSHCIDNCAFSHAGVSAGWVERQRTLTAAPDTLSLEEELGLINGAAPDELWAQDSPLWLRPQLIQPPVKMWRPDLLQVVGHTPMMHVTEKNGLLSTDTFSASSNGRPLGDQRFVIVDTVTKEWYYADTEEGHDKAE